MRFKAGNCSGLTAMSATDIFRAMDLLSQKISIGPQSFRILKQ